MSFAPVWAITEFFHHQRLDSDRADCSDGFDPGETHYGRQKKVVSICYGMGLVICSLEQTSANTTSGIYDYYMALLFPHLSGTMQMAAINSTLPPSTMVQLTLGASTTVPLHFNLSRIYDNQAVAHFAWKHNAFIYGELRGTPLQL